MNSINARLFSSCRAAALAAAFALLGVCAAHAQPAPTSAYADPETAGSVTEPQGEGYVAPQKLNPKLARVTLYRPAQGFAPGVAHLEVNGHYHTSLQLGGYTEVCVEPADFQLAAHMVQAGGELKNFQDATTTLKPQAAQNLYVRVFEYGDGRATLTPSKLSWHTLNSKTPAAKSTLPLASPKPKSVSNPSHVKPPRHAS